MSFEHSRIRKITNAWLVGNERGARKERSLFWKEDVLALGNPFQSEINGDFRERHAAAIKVPQEQPGAIYLNSDAFSSGAQAITQRASTIASVVEAYCKSAGCEHYSFPFSITRAAGFPIRELRVVDKVEDADPWRYDLLLAHKRKKLLVSRDGWVPFGSLVGYQCKTIDDAFDFLKPEEVKEAEADNIQVVRQGDWFFIPNLDLGDVFASRWENEKLYEGNSLRGYRLPHARGANVHIAHEGCEHKGKIYVRGTLRHHRPAEQIKGQNPANRWIWGGMGASHHMLTLDGPYLALENRSLGNFSPTGFFGNGTRKRD